MAMVKLNTFHWHLFDTESFSLVVESQPELSRLGAFAPNQVYTPGDVRDIVQYAKARGVRVLPEGPAHVGEGWQNMNMTTCYNMKPAATYCHSQPCGQFDPSVAELYDVLEDIYREIMENFDPDLFHMGGDGFNFNCWNSSVELQFWMIERGWALTADNFMRLWVYYHTHALERFDRVSRGEKQIILWYSALTDMPYLTEYLDRNRYIIQLWSTEPNLVHNLLENGYNLIVSDENNYYLDCGFSSWTGPGNIMINSIKVSFIN